MTMGSRSFIHSLVSIVSLSIFLLTFTAPAQRAGSNQPSSAPNRLELNYTLSMSQPHTHLYEVTFNIGNVTKAEIDLQMPVWTPGSYLVREFARNVQDFTVKDGAGVRLEWQKIDKATWRIRTGASVNNPKKISADYRVYANDLTVRTSHLDSSHAYFNGASVFMYVKDEIGLPLKLKINAPAGWKVTTPLGLAPDADGNYSAPNYDILVDSPTEIGTHKLVEFGVRNKTHRIAIWGDAAYDENRLKEEFSKIIEQYAIMFGGLPYDHYTFIIHIQPGIRGGLEHLNSTTCQTTPQAFASAQGYINFLNVVSHEYFHLWNVKRMRPFALGPFDYQKENYTTNLWICEGFTVYYESQIVRRAGLMTGEEYLAELGREILSFESTPGRFEQPPAGASFDAWIKYYRPDENSINTIMSYYTSGGLLGLIFDIEIRTRTRGAKTLDDVMRFLFDKYSLPKPGFTDAQIEEAFDTVSGTQFKDFFKMYVYGVEPIDFNYYLSKVGVKLERTYLPGTPYANSKTDKPGTLGMRTRNAVDRVYVANVISGLAAYEGGVNVNDEIIAIDGQRLDAANSVAVLNGLRAGQRLTMTVSRRERLLNIELIASVKPFDRYILTAIKDAGTDQTSLRQAWLCEEAK